MLGPRQLARRVDDQVVRVLALQRAEGGLNLRALHLDHDVLARPMGELRQHIFLLSILAGLPMLVLGALAVRALARPLQRLVAVVDGIAEGDYQQAIQVVGRPAGRRSGRRPRGHPGAAGADRAAGALGQSDRDGQSELGACNARDVSAEFDARERRLLLFDISVASR